jgi:transposase
MIFMDVLYTHCCGLDVHKKNVVACALTPEGKEIRTFSTMTEDLIALGDWLKAKGCTHVAMESTASYWKPIYNLLELEGFHVMVLNAKHIKNVPGRKTDVKDAEWIAGLLQHGLLQGSYIPNREQRELRELIRYRRSMIDERAREINRIQKVLEGANIKLSSVATDILGKSGRTMIEAMIQGQENPQALSELAKGKLKSKKTDLQKAMHGFMGDHQKLMLETQLRHIDFLDEIIAKLDEEVKARMLPFEEDLELLDTIPGVGRRTAEQILAEAGTDMNQFPSAAHLCSWAGVAPGSNESAGKRKSGKAKKGNQKLRSALVEAARAASRTKDTYLASQYHRIAARRGANRAALAVAHSILTIVYHILKRRQPYIELGANYYEERKRQIVVKQSIKKLEVLGYKVTVEEVA